MQRRGLISRRVASVRNDDDYEPLTAGSNIDTCVTSTKLSSHLTHFPTYSSDREFRTRNSTTHRRYPEAPIQEAFLGSSCDEESSTARASDHENDDGDNHSYCASVGGGDFVDAPRADVKTLSRHTSIGGIASAAGGGTTYSGHHSISPSAKRRATTTLYTPKRIQAPPRLFHGRIIEDDYLGASQSTAATRRMTTSCNGSGGGASSGSPRGGSILQGSSGGDDSLCGGVSAASIGLDSPKCYEASSAVTRRVLRVTLDKFATATRTSAVLSTHTRIEVSGWDVEYMELLPIFAVSHLEQVLWGRQMKVHKNILLAAQLAGVEAPKGLSIPSDAVKIYTQTDNLSHVHSFLERFVPHLTTEHFDADAEVFWWRCVGNGLAVLLHRRTGRLRIAKNADKTLFSAVACITKLLSFLQSSPRSGDAGFWIADPEYPQKSDLNDDDADYPVNVETIKKSVIEWAEQDDVSPTSTKYVITTSKAKSWRYSIAPDFRSPDNLVVQVHVSEPLSRGDKAYPVCMSSYQPSKLTLARVRLCYLQTSFFLRKLYDVHVSATAPPQRSPISLPLGISNSAGPDRSRSPVTAGLSKLLTDRTSVSYASQESPKAPFARKASSKTLNRSQPLFYRGRTDTGTHRTAPSTEGGTLQRPPEKRSSGPVY